MPKLRPLHRNLPNTIRIFCEGEKTEPQYIQAYIDDLPDSKRLFVVSIEPTRKNTPVQLVDEAVKFKRSDRFVKGDILWVVYDRESVVKYPDKLHAQAYNKARQNGVKVALSNVCFEYWLLLHLTDSSKPFGSYADLCSASNFRKLFASIAGQDYEKSAIKVYSVLKSGLSDARTRASRISANSLSNAATGRKEPYHLNPYTNVYELLDAIDILKSTKK